MHIFTSLATHQPYNFLITQFFFRDIWGYKPKLMETSIRHEIRDMITTINTYVVQTSHDDDEITQAWNQDLRDELKALDPTSFESIPVLHNFLSIWILLPLKNWDHF